MLALPALMRFTAAVMLLWYWLSSTTYTTLNTGRPAGSSGEMRRDSALVAVKPMLPPMVGVEKRAEGGRGEEGGTRDEPARDQGRVEARRQAQQGEG